MHKTHTTKKNNNKLQNTETHKIQKQPKKKQWDKNKSQQNQKKN